MPLTPFMTWDTGFKGSRFYKGLGLKVEGLVFRILGFRV